jgi:hypothetical protein
MHGSPQTKLELILAGKLGKGTDNIDSLYQQILTFHFKKSDGGLLDLFRAVIGTIVVAKVPVNCNTLQYVLNRWGEEDARQIRVILHRLSSVISVEQFDGLIRMRHLSFPEFLSDAGRCQKDFTIVQSEQHHHLALACLRLMNQGLRFNICDLESSGLHNDDVKNLTSHIERSIPAHLSYACCFWSEHIASSTSAMHSNTELLEEIESFLHNNFLYWLEVLSLIKKVSVASMALFIAVQWIAVSILYYLFHSFRI